MSKNKYDIGIIGGGLAGLALAIEQAKSGRKVILFEKKSYPFHKVCGEYISNESRKYIEYLGIDLNEIKAPEINRLKVSTPRGYELNQTLQSGGFGISRYTLDYKLSKIARSLGVNLKENTTVNDFGNKLSHFEIYTNQEVYQTTFLIGAQGKRSTIDKKMNRHFIRKPLRASKNFIGVKYHIKANLPENLIGLHLFKNGYCGISKVEGDKYCFCYLTLQKNLDDTSSIEKMEQEILKKNSYLADFIEYDRLYTKPLVISQVNFSEKRSVEKGVFMIGDSAGLIVPLCGNGMSMALHSAFALNKLIDEYYSDVKTKKSIELSYQSWWKKEFKPRLTIGRLLQNLVYSPVLSGVTIKLLNKFPGLANFIIRQTHGEPFY